ncbi:MAG: Asp-tRNA(Asn)/Glu-tRNA(Gln) amidotransferase subunit GatA [Acidobacteria bacterium]|nr:Asp-tRNA(Asn)/Glu-tRNA(Gln) amidotransferase subunit GatA [Acidobacteriota bacterium]MYK87018.1 Asp-tRNA(Asn)/Glu-tRNA(Gln) amidotransferase subunit GatA [Acidobacteriota bacterium]
MAGAARPADAETASSIRDDVRSGQRSAVEVCRHYLDRIAESEERWNALTAVFRDEALARAAEVDRRRNEWRDRPLLGVPITVKDVICTQGQPTTAASRILAGFRPPYDATVAARLREAGAIVVGKTNCDEFAMGSSTEHSAYGPSRNPWDPERTPGGSSGGAAAAVAAGLAPVAIGSDTGGSIRQPAAFCGIAGLKPTYGRVSRYGLLAFASSLDQIGPLTRTVADTALVLGVLAGHDPRDATSVDAPVDDYTAALTGDAAGLRVGVARTLLRHGDAGIDSEVLAAFDKALAALAAAGAALVDVELPHAEHAVPVYYLVAPAEASSNLARYDGVRFGARAAATADGGDGAGSPLTAMYDRTRDAGFGAEVKRRIMLGTYALSAGYYDAYYRRAQRVRSLIRRDYDRAFDAAGPGVDVIAMPTTPAPAFRLGEHLQDPLAMYLGDVFTVSANLTGLPAISVPAGLTAARLPIGLQLVGRAFGESTLLRLAHAYERVQEGPA